MLPLLYGMEFIAIFFVIPALFPPQRRIGQGEVKRSDFALLLFALLVIQFIFPRLMGVEKRKPGDGAGGITWRNLALNAALLVFVVPIYEEIVFRGCLFNALMYWFNDKVLWVALTVSVIFAVLHTQYTDWRIGSSGAHLAGVDGRPVRSRDLFAHRAAYDHERRRWRPAMR
ncbi:CPBP family intramembrane metalloprotease [Serratia ureilytica]